MLTAERFENRVPVDLNIELSGEGVPNVKENLTLNLKKEQPIVETIRRFLKENNIPLLALPSVVSKIVSKLEDKVENEYEKSIHGKVNIFNIDIVLMNNDE